MKNGSERPNQQKTLADIKNSNRNDSKQRQKLAGSRDSPKNLRVAPTAVFLNYFRAINLAKQRPEEREPFSEELYG